MPKWIGMMNGPAGGPPVKSMGELVDRVYKNPVQGYAEENYARGPAVGEAFDAVAAPIGQRLGQTFDPASRTYRPAADGESLICMHATAPESSETAASMVAELPGREHAEGPYRLWLSLASGDFSVKFLAALLLLVPYRVLMNAVMPLRGVTAAA